MPSGTSLVISFLPSFRTHAACTANQAMINDVATYFADIQDWNIIGFCLHHTLSQPKWRAEPGSCKHLLELIKHHLLPAGNTCNVTLGFPILTHLHIICECTPCYFTLHQNQNQQIKMNSSKQRLMIEIKGEASQVATIISMFKILNAPRMVRTLGTCSDGRPIASIQRPVTQWKLYWFLVDHLMKLASDPIYIYIFVCIYIYIFI